MTLKDWTQWLIKSIFLATLQIPLLLLSIVVVPLAILFAKDTGESIPFRNPANKGNWKMRKLPNWAWIWSNDHDGTLGDKRGWWAKRWDFKPERFLPQLVWLIWRNPVNNLRNTKLYSCPVSICDISYIGKYVVSDNIGREGWQFVKATSRDTGQAWYGFYAFWLYPWSNRIGLRIRIGFKIKPSHDSTTENKGFAFTMSPFKDAL